MSKTLPEIEGKCPFCGGSGELEEECYEACKHIDHKYWVCCEKCYARGPETYYTSYATYEKDKDDKAKIKAIETWNSIKE